MPAAAHRLMGAQCRVAIEPDRQHVRGVASVLIGAVPHRGDVGRRAHDLFGEQKPRREMTVGTGRPHDHDEALTPESQLERFFGGGDVAGRQTGIGPHSQDVDFMDFWIHRVHEGSLTIPAVVQSVDLMALSKGPMAQTCAIYAGI